MTTATDRRYGVNGGLALKAPVRAATTANITLSGLQTVDSVELAADDRVLVKDQTTASANGIYVASTGTWARAVDFDGNRDIVKGTTVLINEGGQAGQFWKVSSSNPITIGTSDIEFEVSLTASIAMLSFLQDWSAASTRTALAKMREFVSLTDEASGDGATNDAAAVQKVLTGASGRIVDGLGLTYRVDTGLTLPTRTHLRNAIFDFTNAASGADLFVSTGTQGTAIALSANAAAEATSITVSDASSFTAGGYAWISSTSIFETVTNSTRGEIVRISTVDTGTDTLTFYSGLYFAYDTADTATIAPLTLNEDITLENVRATGAGAGLVNSFALFSKCRNVQVINCTGALFDDRNVQFDRCVGCSVVGGSYERTARAGFAYGVAIINGSRDTLVDGVTGRYMRHLVTTGGTTGINLNVKAVHNTALDMLDAGFDAHPSTDYVNYSHNFIQKGVTTSGNSDGIICQGKNFISIGNTIIDAGRYGIIHQLCHNSGEAGTCTISDNYIDNISTHGTYGVFVLTEAGSGSAATGVSIEGNMVRNVTAAHVIVYALGGNITDVSIVSNVALDDSTNYSIQLRADEVDITDFTITGNTARAAGGQAIYMVGTGAGTIEYGNVSANTIRGGSVAAIRGIQTDFITYGPNTIRGATALHSVAGSGSVSHHVLVGSATYDPASLADGAGATTPVTVTGAALGDDASASFSLDLQGITLTAWVSSANTVSVRFQNETGGVLDLGSGTIRARVIKL